MTRTAHPTRPSAAVLPRDPDAKARSGGALRRRLTALVLAASALLPAAAAAQATAAASPAEAVTVIHAGTLLAVPGEKPKTRQTLVVTGRRITAVQDGFVNPPGAKVIDLSDAFVLPGLIDSHVHLQFGGDDYTADLVKMEDGAELLRGYAEAQLALQAGFTTIRDMAGKVGVVFPLRDAINRGVVRGPRIVAAGPAIEPNGGGVIRGFRRDVHDLLLQHNLEVYCDGPEECARTTRRVIRDGADFVKIVATGSILSPASAKSQQFTDAEIKAIIEAAAGMGKKVSAHAHGLPGINASLAAGAQSIEHGSFADASSMELFRKSGAYLVPTMTSLHVLRQRVQAPGTDPTVRSNVLAAYDRIESMVRLAYRSNVKIAYGTDSNIGMLGRNAGEFRLLRNAGMSESDMVRSATVVAAELLGLSNEIGSLTPGRIADVIAVDGSPLEDITRLENVRFVMSRGEVVKP